MDNKVTLVCTKCGLEKLTEEFYKTKTKKGFQSQCKDCDKVYKHSNKERRAETDKIWHYKNRISVSERNREWYEKNRDQKIKTNRKWATENLAKKCSYQSKRKALKLQAYPSWTTEADKMKIEGLFSQSKQMYLDSGIKHHLDHIHPLNPPKIHFFEGEWIGEICGLHSIHNLQILTEYENCSKSNKFECHVESEIDPENPKPWEKLYVYIDILESA